MDSGRQESARTETASLLTSFECIPARGIPIKRATAARAAGITDHNPLKYQAAAMNYKFGGMHVGGMEDSTFLLLRAVAAGWDPEITIMNRPSFRAILFVAVLSTLHIAGIAPLKVAAIQSPRGTASQPAVPVDDLPISEFKPNTEGITRIHRPPIFGRGPVVPGAGLRQL